MVDETDVGSPGLLPLPSDAGLMSLFIAKLSRIGLKIYLRTAQSAHSKTNRSIAIESSARLAGD
jgi:hypothetical protein